MKVLVGLGGCVCRFFLYALVNGLHGFSRVLRVFAWGLGGFLVLRVFLGLHGISSDVVGVVSTVFRAQSTLEKPKRRRSLSSRNVLSLKTTATGACGYAKPS